VNFGTQKANVAVALLVATLKAGLVAAIFMHLSAEKRLIYRVLILRLFRPWTFLAHLTSPGTIPFTANVDQRFSHCFYRLLDPAGVGNRLLLRLGRFDRGRAGLSDRAIASFVSAVVLIVYGVLFYRKMKRLRLIT